MFKVDDKIYYPMHGVGTVESIERKSVLGEIAEYYILRFNISRMTAMVPTDTAEAVGLRKIIDNDECQKVMKFLAEGECQECDNWNQRYRENLSKLKTGSIYDVAEVVKSLIKRDKERSLSAGERKMLLTARQVLLSELSLVSGIPQEEIVFESKIN